MLATRSSRSARNGRNRRRPPLRVESRGKLVTRGKVKRADYILIAAQVPTRRHAAVAIAPSGCENYGGPVVTASGLVFIGATICDHALRAFDARTGAQLWQAALPAAGNSTPAVYEVGGKQFVVIGAARCPEAARQMFPLRISSMR